MMFKSILTLACLAAPALGVAQAMSQGYETPARGSATRAALMEAIRPHVEWMLAPPIEFIVDDLRVSGNVSFASLYAQRPGGVAIVMEQTPMHLRDGWNVEMGDGATVQVLYQLEGNTWVAVHNALAATDVWYSWQEYCPIWAPVLPEYCG